MRMDPCSIRMEEAYKLRPDVGEETLAIGFAQMLRDSC